MGTDIHGSDSIKASERTVRNALWRNFLTAAGAFGQPRENMDVEVIIGVREPNKADAYKARVKPSRGGGGVAACVEAPSCRPA